MHWCYIKLLSACFCYILTMLSLALGLRPSNKVLRLLGQNLNSLSRVKLTFDAQAGKRRSVVALAKRQYTEVRLYHRASWKQGHKPARKRAQGRKIVTQRAPTFIKAVCRRVLSGLYCKFGPESCIVSKQSLQFELLTDDVVRRAGW
jgi:hypothetical protein